MIYVSESALPPEQADDEIAKIIAVSNARNQHMQVTGAFLFTGERFVQVLEGKEESVRQIMANVERDPRHRQIIILRQEHLKRRRFSGWAMAYAGRSTFAGVLVERAALDRDDYAVRNVLRLLQEFTRSSDPAPSAT